MINKQTITAAIIGACLVIFAFHAWQVYQFKRTLIAHELFNNKILCLLNGGTIDSCGLRQK